MQASALVVDEIIIGSNDRAWIKRVYSQFDRRVWMALEEPAHGQKVGAIRMVDPKVRARAEEFPRIPGMSDNGLIGFRTQHNLDRDTVYALGMPQGYLDEYLDVTFGGISVALDRFVSPDFRLLRAAHFPQHGLLRVEIRITHDPNRIADIIGDRQQMPRAPALPFQAAAALRAAVLNEPAKTIDVMGGIIGLFTPGPR